MAGGDEYASRFTAFEAALAVTACAEEDDCRPVRLGAAAEDAFVPEAIETIALDVTGERRHPTAPGVFLALTGRHLGATHIEASPEGEDG